MTTTIQSLPTPDVDGLEDESRIPITILNVTRGGRSSEAEEVDLATYAFPVDELRDRTIELPPRGETRLILYSPNTEDTEEAKRLLGDAWKILMAVTSLRELSEVKRKEGLELTPLNEKRSRLWSPNPCLESSIGMIESRISSFRETSRDEGAKRRHLTGSMSAIDIGCGTGRDVVFLANERGWDNVVGVDRVGDFLEKMMRFARRAGGEECSNRVSIVMWDICSSIKQSKNRNGDEGATARTSSSTTTTTQAAGADPLAAEFLSSFDLVILSRFMDKAVLRHLAASLRRPGTFVLIHHFLWGSTSNATKRPLQREQTLELGELEREFFPSDRFEVCVSRESRLKDGRGTVDFVAMVRGD